MIRRTLYPLRYHKPKSLFFKGDGAKYIGFEEPSWPDVETQRAWSTNEYQMAVATALNWYSQTQDTKTGVLEVLEVLKGIVHRKSLIEQVEKNKTTIKSTGLWLVRMMRIGFYPRFKELRYLVKAIRGLQLTDNPRAAKKKPNVQDHVAAKVRSVKGEIDYAFDNFVRSGCKEDISIGSILQANSGVPTNKLKELREYCAHYAKEMQLAKEDKDGDIAEAYSNFGKRQLKSSIEWWESAIQSIDRYAQIKHLAREPRTKKPKSPEQVVSGLRYMKAFDSLKLSSIAPTKILNSNELWVYNTKVRKLCRYVASQGMTLGVSGNKIINFDTAKSTQKTIRKPEKQLIEFMKLDKAGLGKWFKSIKTLDIAAKESLSNECILLRLSK